MGAKRRFAFRRVETIDAQEAQHGGAAIMIRHHPHTDDDDDDDVGGGGVNERKTKKKKRSPYKEVRRFRSNCLYGRDPSLTQQQG